jgi:hypothetical protein
MTIRKGDSMTPWRFRTGLFGKLILQRLLSTDGAYEEWVDAKSTDLLDFYKFCRVRA